MNGNILIIDDDQSMCEMLEANLQRRGFSVTWSLSADEAFTLIMKEDYDVLLTDLNLPGMNGIELCERAAANRPDVPVVVITAFGSLDTAVAAIRAGAYDFITKPIDIDLLVLALERAIKYHALHEKVKILSQSMEQFQCYGELIGNSEPMHKLCNMLSRVADTETSVLITGESGTGKELAARALHNQSQRRNGPFVAVNCPALPPLLLESELFGHKRGAFTDAKVSRDGLFQQAKGGTLFLDEVGDFPMQLQPKLLRTLEQRSVRPVGSDSEVAVDVRIIAATNTDLESAVEDGRFRDDLFYRLNVIQVNIPPLRARGMDILLLAQHFIKQFASTLKKQVLGISDTAAEKLLNYSWPGNVRELRNALERAVTLTRYEKLAVDDLPEKIRAYHSPHVLLGSSNPAELVSIQEVERRYINHVLKTVNGNRTLAAKILGLDRKTLYRKLQSYKTD